MEPKLPSTFPLFLLTLSSIISFAFSQNTHAADLTEDQLENLEGFFRDNPDIYGKMQAIERLAADKNHNATELKILHEEVIRDLQPRIIESCDEVFYNKQRELYQRIFVYKNASKLYNMSTISFGNQDLMQTAVMMTLYRDQLTQFVKKCIRKGAMSLRQAERIEFDRRVNLSLLRTDEAVKDAVRLHSAFELDLDVKKSFCCNVVEKWLEPHIVEMERMFMIEQRQTYIPLNEDMRKRFIDQCFIYVQLQKDYIENCVKSAGEDQRRDIHPMTELRHQQ